MTGGGSSIPEVRALLRTLAAGRDVAELGTAFGEGAAAMDPVREFLLRDPRLVAAEILTTPETAAIVDVRL